MQASVRAITAASAGKGSAEAVEASLVEVIAYMRSPIFKHINRVQSTIHPFTILQGQI